MKIKETVIKVELPFRRVAKHKLAIRRPLVPRITGMFFGWGGGSIQEFGGSRINTTRHLSIFGWRVLTINRNQYHDESDKERAERYLSEWSKCEKELRGLRLLQMGDAYPDPELRKLLRDGLGIDLDEGTVR